MTSNQNLPEDLKQELEQLATKPVPDKPKEKPSERGISGAIAAENYPTVSLRAGRASMDFPDVKNNYELDNAIIGQTVKHNGAIIQTPWRSSLLTIPRPAMPDIRIPAEVRPVLAFLVYIKKDSIPSGVHESYTLSKKKGFSRQFSSSIEIKSSVSTGILGCEASLEVTTGFSYSETITEETEETWKRSMTGPNDYWTFQPALVYAYKIPFNLQYDAALKSSFGAFYYTKDSSLSYVFIPVYRDTPSVVDHEIGYVPLSDAIDYLCNEGWSRW